MARAAFCHVQRGRRGHTESTHLKGADDILGDMKIPRPQTVSATVLCALLTAIDAHSMEAGASVSTRERTTTKIAEGVYVIRHKDAPDDFPQGNTTVVIGEREAFVVDSCYLPSSAREDIADIRRWTDKPVRYLLNTHWHYDHTRGNGAYAEAFPSLSIIAHVDTRRMMEARDPSYPVRYAERQAALQAQLDSGKGADGKALAAADRTTLAQTFVGQRAVLQEYEGYVDWLPDVRFDHELDVDLGNREVRVLHLGRGNTAGDAVVSLPAEKIVITGDVLVHPVPYCFGGYPSDWIGTLEALKGLGAETIVPGHGEIQHDDAYVNRVIGLLKTVTSRVQSEVARRPATKVEDLQKAIDTTALRQEFAGDDKDNREFFDQSIAKLIETARSEAVAR